MPHQEIVCLEIKDVISDLPKVIIERILECMPLRDVGRTSILSRKWRHYWETLPQLVFSRDFFEGAAGNILRDIYAVIVLHSGPITNFVLQIPENSPAIFDDHVDVLVLLLSRNGIKKLSLENSNPVAVHIVPSNLFSCLNLTHLKLRNYTFQPLPAFKGFRFLRSLVFYEITIPSGVLEMLISSSPLLKKFTLDLCHVVNHFIIHAPNLSYLWMHGAYKFSLQETRNLAVAYVNLTKMDGQLEYEYCNLNQIVQCFPRIERLVVGNDTLDIFGAGTIWTKLSMKLFCLKYLELHETCLHIRKDLRCALWFIASSPKLQELKITASPLDLEGKFYLSFSDEDYLHQLQIIRFQRIKGFMHELELIRYLLACSPMLQSMVIERDSQIHVNNENALLRALLQYPRASPKVKITYLEPSGGKDIS